MKYTRPGSRFVRQIPASPRRLPPPSVFRRGERPCGSCESRVWWLTRVGLGQVGEVGGAAPTTGPGLQWFGRPQRLRSAALHHPLGNAPNTICPVRIETRVISKLPYYLRDSTARNPSSQPTIRRSCTAKRQKGLCTGWVRHDPYTDFFVLDHFAVQGRRLVRCEDTSSHQLIALTRVSILTVWLSGS